MQTPGFPNKIYPVYFPWATDPSIVLNMSFLQKFDVELWFFVLENWEKGPWKSWKSPGFFSGSWCTNPVMTNYFITFFTIFFLFLRGRSDVTESWIVPMAVTRLNLSVLLRVSNLYEYEYREFGENCHSVTFYFVKKESERCCDTTTPGSIHTKDESKCGPAFAFIFGVNWPVQWM